MSTRPLKQIPIKNSLPDSALEALHRRFTKYQKEDRWWNLQGNDDDAYLKALKSEIDRREKAPEPDRAVKTRRAEYALDRENLSERVPLHALELKKRDLLNVKRYFPEGFKDADVEYLRELKKLIKLQKYRKTLKQKAEPYEEVEHFEAPTAEEKEEKEAELKIAEAAPETRRSGRERKQAVQFEAGQGAGLDYKKNKPTAGVDDIEPDEEDRVRKAPANYVPRGREKTMEELQEQAEADDDDERDPTPDVPEAQRTTSSGMTDQQLERVKKLYYGTGDSPAMVSSAAAMYPLLLAEGDPPSTRQLQAWVAEQGLSQSFKPFHAKGSDVKPFTATSPLRNFGMDLFTATDYGSKEFDKASRKGRYWDRWGKAGYGLVVIDEYSRMIFTETLNTKSPTEVAKKLKLILDRIGKLNGGKQIGYIRSDDGVEFLGETAELLKERGIRNVRTLGGAPQSNGQAERAVSSIRKTLSRQYVVSGQSWRTLLPKATQVHNKTVNRTTGRSPADAVQDTSKADMQQLRSDQFESQQKAGTEPRPDLEVGTIVKLRTAPDSMNKTSKQSFYENPLIVKEVKRGNDVQATRYRLEDPEAGPSNQRILSTKLYPRNYVNVVGREGDTTQQVRERENMDMLKKGRWLRAVR